jgi:hypothetical protein
VQQQSNYAKKESAKKEKFSVLSPIPRSARGSFTPRREKNQLKIVVWRASERENDISIDLCRVLRCASFKGGCFTSACSRTDLRLQEEEAARFRRFFLFFFFCLAVALTLLQMR